MALASWKKIDFHTHTPASFCFKNRNSVTVDQWITAVKGSGLNAVVITDHNSVDWIDKIRSSNLPKNELFVYPGVELCVGTSYTHILLIFDPNMKTSDIEDFVVQCGIPKSSWGDTTKYVKEDVLSTLIQQHKDKVLVIPAHFSSNKGIGKTLGENGIQAFHNNIPFDAIEIRNEEDFKEVANKVKNKKLPQIALVCGSDNPGVNQGEHGLVGFGQAFTWIKISEYSLEALRQVFLDYTLRSYCVLAGDAHDETFSEIKHNHIQGIHIRNLKHVSDLSLRFSPYLNTIVGGRGTGKSTIIEMIRLVLSNTQEITNKKRNSKLIETYQDDSEVDLYYGFGATNNYKISLSGKKNKKIVVENEEGIIKDSPSFAAEIYSQKELYSIVDDDENPEKNSVSPMLDIVDKNIQDEKVDLQGKIELILKELISISLELAIKKMQVKDIPRLKADLELSEGNLSAIKNAGILELREKISKAHQPIIEIEAELENIVSDFKEIDQKYNNRLILAIHKIHSTVDQTVGLLDDLKLVESIEDLNKTVAETSYYRLDKANKIKSVLNESNYLKEFSLLKNKYQEMISIIDILDVEKIKEFETDIEKKKGELIRLSKIQFELEQLVLSINIKIDDLFQAYKNLSEKRQEVLKLINEKAVNINLSLKPFDQNERWLFNLRKSIGKENNFDADFKKVKESIFGNKDLIVDKLKEWLQFLLLSETGDISEFLSFENFYDVRFKNIWIDKKNDKTIQTFINFIPEDRIEIKIINEGSELDINDGSPGQKTAAILAFVLNQGRHPLIIDQPEDDLDNSLIQDLIVENIRKLKSRRQLIIVTHNPNIPVLGDAEGIIILDRSYDGAVALKNDKKAGCIEEKMIKKGICDIMEGGIDAFKKREQKYKYIEK